MGLPRGGDQLAKLFAATVVIHDSPPPRRKEKGNSAGVRGGKDDDDDGDCVILDGDPHRPVAVAGAGYGGGSDEVEIVAVRGEVLGPVPFHADDRIALHLEHTTH
jgi:hypothetical protein